MVVIKLEITYEKNKKNIYKLEDIKQLVYCGYSFFFNKPFKLLNRWIY